MYIHRVNVALLCVNRSRIQFIYVRKGPFSVGSGIFTSKGTITNHRPSLMDSIEMCLGDKCGVFFYNLENRIL
jgi:hypothetical protein